jgi:hypothetical protein
VKTRHIPALIFAWAASLMGASFPAHALDRAGPADLLGITISGHDSALSGAFARTLSADMGFSLSLDMGASWLNDQTRIFVRAGLQNFQVIDSSRLSLATAEGFAGLRLNSQPFFWNLEPTLELGVGGINGTMLISGTTSETPNSKLWMGLMVQPGVLLNVWGGLSIGAGIPIRHIFATKPLTTWSPALTLRYSL